MKIDNTLNFLFSETTNLFWVKLEQSMREIGLHSGQIFVLISLWNEDGKAQIELSQILNLSPPTINKMIKSLENKTDFFISDSRQFVVGHLRNEMIINPVISLGRAVQTAD